MSGLEPSRPRTPRRTREQRAYRLVMTGGAFGVVAVVGLVLAIAGVLGWGIPLIAAVVAIVCFMLFRRAFGRAPRLRGHGPLASPHPPELRESRAEDRLRPPARL